MAQSHQLAQHNECDANTGQRGRYMREHGGSVQPPRIRQIGPVPLSLFLSLFYQQQGKGRTRVHEGIANPSRP